MIKQDEGIKLISNNVTNFEANLDKKNEQLVQELGEMK